MPDAPQEFPTRPQFTLRDLIWCTAVIAVGLAGIQYWGNYSIGLLPFCLTMLISLAAGGTLKESLFFTLFVYAVAVFGILGVLLFMLLAVGIGLLTS